MSSELATIIGRNIRAAREEKGIGTQRELADKIREFDPQLATNNTRVSIWERGAETPSDRQMKALVKVLEKTPDWFYTNHQKPPAKKPPTETPDISSQPTLRHVQEQNDEILDRLNRIDAALSILFSERALIAATQRDIEQARQRLVGGSS